MFAVIIMGIIAIIWAVANWYFELKNFLDRKELIDYSRHENNVFRRTAYRWGVRRRNIRAFFIYGKYFMIDIAITMAAVEILGFEGLAGGILGLLFSNAVSVLILVIMRIDNKRRLALGYK